MVKTPILVLLLPYNYQTQKCGGYQIKLDGYSVSSRVAALTIILCSSFLPWGIGLMAASALQLRLWPHSALQEALGTW